MCSEEVLELLPGYRLLNPIGEFLSLRDRGRCVDNNG